MRPIDVSQVVRGQYKGYRDEPGVSKRSQTETFIAAKVVVDNWRWHGVPFFLRTGKSLAQSRQVITIGLPRPGAQDVPGERRRDPRESSQRARDRLQGSRLDHRELPHQGAGPAHAARRGRHGVPVHRLVGRGEQPRGLRAAHPQRDARRPGAVHALRRHREAVGDLHAAARQPPAGAAVRAGVMGPDSIKQLIAPFQWRLPE